MKLTVDFGSTNDWHDYYYFFDSTEGQVISKVKKRPGMRSRFEVEGKLQQIKNVHVNPSKVSVLKVKYLQAWIEALEWVLGEDE